MKEITNYDLILITFMGAIMAQSGCSKDEALMRIATLCAITEKQMGVKAKAEI